MTRLNLSDLLFKCDFFLCIIEITKVSGYGTRAIRLPKNMFVHVPFPNMSSTLLSSPLYSFVNCKDYTHTGYKARSQVTQLLFIDICDDNKFW
jgi:hypothetical protein